MVPRGIKIVIKMFLILLLIPCCRQTAKNRLGFYYTMGSVLFKHTHQENCTVTKNEVFLLSSPLFLSPGTLRAGHKARLCMNPFMALHHNFKQWQSVWGFILVMVLSNWNVYTVWWRPVLIMVLVTAVHTMRVSVCSITIPVSKWMCDTQTTDWQLAGWVLSSFKVLWRVLGSS